MTKVVPWKLRGVLRGLDTLEIESGRQWRRVERVTAVRAGIGLARR